MTFEELLEKVDGKDLMTEEELVESEVRTEVWARLSELIEELEKRVPEEFLIELGVLTPPDVIDLTVDDCLVEVEVGGKRKFELIDLTND